MEVLRTFRSNFLKWHTALVDDPCLMVVPGSQRRFRTEREHECLDGEDRHGEIPGAVRIRCLGHSPRLHADAYTWLLHVRT